MRLDSWPPFLTRTRHAVTVPFPQAQQQHHAFAPPPLPPPQHYPDARGLSGALSALALGDEDVPLVLAPLLASAGGAAGAPASLLAPRRPAPPPLLKGPSGPRRAGEGVEEEEQAVVSVEKLANGGLQVRRMRCLTNARVFVRLSCARARSAHLNPKRARPTCAPQLRVTLLAAGFVIGAAGASVREIGAATGAVVQSWSGTTHKCKCAQFCALFSRHSFSFLPGRGRRRGLPRRRWRLPPPHARVPHPGPASRGGGCCGDHC
jgi:hypothetical protein